MAGRAPVDVGSRENRKSPGIGACGERFIVYCLAAATLPLDMAAKPVLENWMLHHSEAGVRCVGAIRNHQKFPDGSFIRTSVVVARFPGGILTENGSAYMLGNKHPQNGVQSQGLYLSLPNAMKPQQEKAVPRPTAIPQKR